MRPAFTAFLLLTIASSSGLAQGVLPGSATALNEIHAAWNVVCRASCGREKNQASGASRRTHWGLLNRVAFSEKIETVLSRLRRSGTMAEAWKTKEQLASLTAEGCGEFQGFLFSRPRPAAEVERLLGEGASQAAAVA